MKEVEGRVRRSVRVSGGQFAPPWRWHVAMTAASVICASSREPAAGAWSGSSGTGDFGTLPVVASVDLCILGAGEMRRAEREVLA